MIYTVTFNPSLDYVVRVEHFQGDKVNRASEEHVYPEEKEIMLLLYVRILECRAGHWDSVQDSPEQRWNRC